MKKFTSKNQKIGVIGENIAETFLVKQGFLVIDRNFSSRFGEIDIIALKNNQYHFIEVKTITVSRVTTTNPSSISLGEMRKNVSRETLSITNIEEISKHCSIPPKAENQQLSEKRHVSRETFIQEYRNITNPFQNISKKKIEKLLKTVELYLVSKKISSNTSWQIDGIGVCLFKETTDYSVEYLERITVT